MKLLTLSDIQRLIANEMEQTERVMQREIYTEVALAQSVMQYALQAKGKRFRPMLHLLSAGVCDYRGDFAPTAAAFIEFIHNATLLHDDVVDSSDIRRGQASAHIIFSNAASILVGDFLYTRAFQLMVSSGNAAVLKTMADATNLIAAGEVMQLANMHNLDIDETCYYRVIELKTAVLFSAACKIAAQLAGVSEEKIAALADYGKKLGMAFQMIDDMLDYMGDESKIGKALGDDLAEGKPTMPLIRALQQLCDPDQKRLRAILQTGDREAIMEVIALLKKTDALAYTQAQAEKMATAAAEALMIFPENDYKNALISLAYQAVHREA